MRHQVYKCDCDKAGDVKIDMESNTMTCGVVGLVNVNNCRVISGVVLCDSCKDVIYKESR